MVCVCKENQKNCDGPDVKLFTKCAVPFRGKGGHKGTWGKKEIQRFYTGHS